MLAPRPKCCPRRPEVIPSALAAERFRARRFLRVGRLMEYLPGQPSPTGPLPMENIERWISQSAMSDIGRHGAAVAALPANVGGLIRVVQGVIIHTEWLHAYGLDLSTFARVSRDTLPVAERLTLVLNGDG